MSSLPPEALTLLSAISYTGANVFIRLGLRHSAIGPAAVVIQSIPLVIFGAVLLFKNTPPLMAQGIFFFIIGGLSSPGLGSSFRLLGMMRLGVGRSNAVTGSSPIFALLLALLFLHERPGFFLWLGAGLIVAGVGLLSGEGKEGGWRKGDLIFPILCALCMAVGSNFRKAGLNLIPSAILGVFFSNSAGVGALLLTSPYLRQREGLSVEREAWPYLILTGFCLSLGHLLFLGALSGGSISLVMPLFQIQSLLTLLASYLFLRQLERWSGLLVFGALMIVAGAVLVVTFKPV